MRLLSKLIVLSASLVSGIVAAANPESFDSVIDPFIDQHCVKCHGEEKQKGDIRLDTIGRDFSDASTELDWQDIADILMLGDMPPEDEPRPDIQEIRKVLDSIEHSISESLKAESPTQEIAIRRLSHSALDNISRDLLNVPIPLSSDLPADPEVAGFENLAETMETSQEFMNKLQENARRLAEQAIVEGPDIRSDKSFPQSKMGRGSRVIPIGKDMATWSSKNKFNCLWPNKFVAPAYGSYRIRIQAYAKDNRHEFDRKNISYDIINPRRNQLRSMRGRVAEEAPRLVAIKANEAYRVRSEGGEATYGRQVGLIQVDKRPGWHEVDVLLEKGENIFLHYISSPRLQWPAFAMINGKKTLIGETLFVRNIEVEGPLMDSWPTGIQKELLGDGEPDGPSLESRLAKFLKRAFRGPVPQSTIKRFATLYNTGLKEGLSPEASMQNVLVGALCSPRFLYNYERADQNKAWALANRLSLFIWNSMPDEQLFALAESGKLLKPEIIKAEARRMLKDPKSKRFTTDFAAQWLGLKKVGAMLPDPKLYPDYDPALEMSMRKESELFFEEILRDNLPIETFLDSKFAMLNERLAQHYDISGVKGQEFRKVSLPRNSPRGGILTHASVLTITSNGTRTSPVVRGVWMLENIFDAPPNNPPPDIEPIEPDVRGAITIREMLKKHREIDTCKDCHSRIDPWGFSMENFNAVGQWRDRYFNRKRVDATGTLTDGTAFKGIKDIKKILLERSDRFSHALTTKLFTYALGHHPSLSERQAIDAIVENTRKEGNGLANLIVNICASPAFIGENQMFVSK